MARRVWVLLLAARLALAQEGKEGSAAAPPAERTTPYPAREPGKKPTAVVIQRKIYSLSLPADWVLREVDAPGAELSWEILLPGSASRAALTLSREEELGDPRAAPYYRAEQIRADTPNARVGIRPEPSPRLLVERLSNGTDWIDASLFLWVRFNPYVLHLSCAASDFAQAELDMLVAARSFDADVELWPPIPKGYDVIRHGIWLVGRAPDVTASLAPLLKTLKDEERRFARFHGALSDNQAPLVVLVHASQADAAKIEPAAAEVKHGAATDVRGRRVFATPHAEADLDHAGALTFSARGLLFLAKYGDVRPRWLWQGERTVAQAESYADKPLPALDNGFAKWVSTLTLHRIDELDEVWGRDQDAWTKECFFHVAALHAGKYRKRFRSFLDDYARSGDGEGAFARHLGTLDPEDLRSSTEQFIATGIRPEKRKKRD